MQYSDPCPTLSYEVHFRRTWHEGGRCRGAPPVPHRAHRRRRRDFARCRSAGKERQEWQERPHHRRRGGNVVQIELKRDRADIKARRKAFEFQAIRYAVGFTSINTQDELPRGLLQWVRRRWRSRLAGVRTQDQAVRASYKGAHQESGKTPDDPRNEWLGSQSSTDGSRSD